MKKQNQKPFITPDMLQQPHLNIREDELKQIADKEWQKQFKKSDAYQKYIQPMLDDEKALKKQHRINWWWNKGLPLFSAIFSLVAAVTGVIALIMK